MKTLPLLFTLLTPWIAPAAIEEFHPRGGLPNFTRACEDGRPVKVAYFGGSITAAPGWRVKTLEWFKTRWPRASFSEIHAAIGGTGSDLGVFRCDNDVLAGRPDLVFVEFAVNDGGAPPERIHKAMEGIVRKIWTTNPTADICYVYTLQQSMLQELKDGKPPRSVTAMEQLADHHGIPSVNFGVEVARLEAAGELVFKAPKPEENGKRVFSPDGVHPFVETGHALYLEAVQRAFARLPAPPAAPAPHVLKAPLREDHWQAAGIQSLRREWLKGEGWEALPKDKGLGKSFANRLPELWQADRPGAALEFAFTGTMVGLFDLLGPDGGQVRVTVDGQDKGLRARFDAYCTYHRLAPLWLAEDLPPGRHTVRVELVSDPLDKAAILAKRNEKMDDPARFAPLRWQVGSLLVAGTPE